MPFHFLSSDALSPFPPLFLFFLYSSQVHAALCAPADGSGAAGRHRGHDRVRVGQRLAHCLLLHYERRHAALPRLQVRGAVCAVQLFWEW